jgi:hypothetical protein
MAAEALLAMVDSEVYGPKLVVARSDSDHFPVVALPAQVGCALVGQYFQVVGGCH